MKNKIVYVLLGTILSTLEATSQRRAQDILSSRKQNTIDSTLQRKLITRDLTHEVAAEKGATIHINNTRRNLDIRLWSEPKVKIVTTVTVDEKNASVNMEELMKESGITFRSFGNRVDLELRSRPEYPQDVERFEPFDQFLEQSQNSNNLTQRNNLSQKNGSSILTPTTAETELADILLTQKKSYWSATSRNNLTMTIYIPEDSKLDIDNKNTDIIINGNIGTASFKLTRSNLDARNFKKLTVIAEYYNINISDVEEAELELDKGTFTGGIIAILDLDSQGSEVEYESGVNIYMRSKQDRITVDQISRVTGRKLYGELRIGKLVTELDIEGIGTDVKIRNITNLTEKIRLVNQYADLRLPVRNLSDYTVSFYGKNSTVFAPFEKTAVPLPKEDEIKEGKKTDETVKSTVTGEFDTFFNKLSQYNSLGAQKGPSKFTASVGNLAGKYTRFEIECHQCSVDFK
jgi:hypothetical protein